jgi:hypothetical protein
MADNHIEPVKIEDRHLLAYLDGELDAQTTAIIESSAEYLKRAQELRRMQNRLRARLQRVDCPESTELGEYQLALLSRKRSKAIEAHLNDCPHCRRELEQLRAFLHAEAQQEKPHSLEGVKILVARLLGVPGESGGLVLSPAYAALRGLSRGPVTLEAQGALILLDLQPGEAGHMTLLGQVAADEQEQWTGAAVELRREGRLLLRTSLDDLGAFQAANLEPGSIELTIESNAGPIILANFEVQED